MCVVGERAAAQMAHTYDCLNRRSGQTCTLLGRMTTVFRDQTHIVGLWQRHMRPFGGTGTCLIVSLVGFGVSSLQALPLQ